MSTEHVGVAAWPLYWPDGWVRTKSPRRAPFRDTTIYKQTQMVRAEMARLCALNVVVSSNLQLRNDGVPYSNQKMPADVGVAVWFWLGNEDGGKDEHVLACDRWDRPEANLHAIALHVAAIRGQERWGVGTAAQAFRGYQAIPAKTGIDWRAELGLGAEATVEHVQAVYRRLAQAAHPDKGGEREKWDRLVAARDAALEELSA